MNDQIIGMMFCKNEADILEETITDAASKVDQLYLADDGSTDKSWDIINFCKDKISNVTHIQREPNKYDPGQRASLLNKIKKRFKYEETWVQVIEADVFLLSSPREAIKNSAVEDMAVTWSLVNAVRKPNTWGGVDTYPNWNNSIREIMPYCHWMETLLYSFRPLPKLYYSYCWRPWPKGFSNYTKNKVKLERRKALPVALHCGYRGPTHFYLKYKSHGNSHKKYKNWKVYSVDMVEKTVPFFGEYAAKSFPWQKYL